MIGFDPGAIVDGHEAGQNRQNKQEQMKMAKEQHYQKTQMNNQAMNMQDLQIQQLQTQVTAQDKLQKVEQAKQIRSATSLAFNDGTQKTSQASVEALNLARGETGTSDPMRLPSMSEFKTRDTTMKYLDAKGYSLKPFLIDPETGEKTEHTDSGYNNPSDIKAKENAEKENMALANSMNDAGLLIQTQDGQVMGFEDIGVATGMFKVMPETERRLTEILAGVRAKEKDPTAVNPNARRDSLKQTTDAFFAAKGPRPEGNGPEAQQWDKDYRQMNSDWQQKSVAGTGSVNENQNVLETAANFKTTQGWEDSGYMVDVSKVSKSDLASMSRVSHQNSLNNKDANGVYKKTKENMIGRKQAIEQTLTLLDDTKPGGKYDKLDKDVIANGIQVAKNLVGVTDEKAVTNMDWNTRSGMILAGYLRSMSGLTVTEQERKFIMGIMTSGNFSDEKSMIKAIEGFGNEMKREQNSNANALFYHDPYTATAMRMYSNLDTGEATTGGGAGSTNTGGGGGGATVTTEDATKVDVFSQKDVKSTKTTTTPGVNETPESKADIAKINKDFANAGKRNSNGGVMMADGTSLPSIDTIPKGATVTKVGEDGPKGLKGGSYVTVDGKDYFYLPKKKVVQPQKKEKKGFWANPKGYVKDAVFGGK